MSNKDLRYDFLAAKSEKPFSRHITPRRKLLYTPSDYLHGFVLDDKFFLNRNSTPASSRGASLIYRMLSTLFSGITSLAFLSKPESDK